MAEKFKVSAFNFGAEVLPEKSPLDPPYPRKNICFRPETFKKPGEQRSFQQAGPFSRLRKLFSSLWGQFTSLTNPVCRFPDPFSTLPNPFSSRPQPFSSLPNPCSSLPTSFCSLPNPLSCLLEQRCKLLCSLFNPPESFFQPPEAIA